MLSSLDARAIAHDDPDHAVRLEDAVGLGGDVVQRQGAHRVGVGGPVVVGQAEADHLDDVAHDRAVGSPAPRQGQRPLVLDAGQLLGGRRAVAAAADAADLLVDL